MAEAEALGSVAAYSRFVAQALERPSVSRSTLAVWSASPYTGVAEGEVFFAQDYRLRIREEIDFDANLITSYGYEVYRGEQKLYWYDDFPHPQDPKLATTFPHHKHTPPDIKRNRLPAPHIRFEGPNLLFLIGEIEALIG